jgi:hypothetical protein
MLADSLANYDGAISFAWASQPCGWTIPAIWGMLKQVEKASNIVLGYFRKRVWKARGFARFVVDVFNKPSI